MKSVFLFLILCLFGNRSHADTSRYLKVGTLNVHHAVFEPQISTIGDILFLHGYGDSFENHQPLFKSFTSKGFRVIGFDYPSHGKTRGEFWDDLDNHSFGSLTRIASQVLAQYRRDISKPLIVVGWSTGGLHAIRITQNSNWRTGFPGLSGLILYAPGVSVRTCVGNDFCHISNDTLTHNVALQSRPIEPGSPIYRLEFATKLIFNSWLSWQKPLPKDIPTLLFVASENDRYVKTKEIKQWVRRQRTVYRANIEAYQCINARHELDNEPQSYGGVFVKEASAKFAASIALKNTIQTEKSDGTCEGF